jgi:hypothetical protein
MRNRSTTTGGAIPTVACGELVSGIGSTAGTTGQIDQGIGHYGSDGKLRDTGIIFNTKATVRREYSRYLQG